MVCFEALNQKGSGRIMVSLIAAGYQLKGLGRDGALERKEEEEKKSEISHWREDNHLRPTTDLLSLAPLFIRRRRFLIGFPC